MAGPSVIVERNYTAPRELVWAVLADTNRYDRFLGFNLPRYSWRDVDGRRQLVGAAEQTGVKLEWIEEPYEWIEGQSLESKRLFLKGPASEGGVSVVVEDAPGGTRAVLTAHGEAKSFALRALGPLVRAGLRRKIEGYLAAVADLLDAELARAPDAPAAAQVQDILRGREQHTLSGSVTRADPGELQRRGARLDAPGLDDQAKARLLEALTHRPDEEVTQMRPFELARAWGLDRRSVLRVFLHATQAGLVDLNWQLNCPVCKVAAGVVRSLEEVSRDVHCDACNISYGNDFATNVEAVFKCNQALRDVQPTVYCAASPSFRPHVLAQLKIGARQRRELSLPLRDARLHARTLGTHAAADCLDQEPPERLEVRVTPDAVHLASTGRATDGATRLVIVSETDVDEHVLLERGAWAADVVLGSVVASMPEFVDLFATEAPAAGLDLSVGSLTFLFSDLTGSTALYEKIGDAKAYAVVQEHFRQMEQTIARHGGAIVKTMGDAVMATFGTPVDAVRAALEAVAEDHRTHEGLGIGIKLGVHEGACLAVRANERLDYFGTTVNVAARLQGKADTSQLVMIEELAGRPEVLEALNGVASTPFAASLKGIEGKQSLIAFDLRASAASGA